MKAHFVTFYSPGTLVAEQTTKPIDSWDVDKATQMARDIKERHGATPYAFQFTTRERGDLDLDSRETKQSPTYYLGGVIMDIEQVKEQMPNERILISNMEINGYSKIVINSNSWRVCRPLEHDDVVLEFTK